MSQKIIIHLTLLFLIGLLTFQFTTSCSDDSGPDPTPTDTPTMTPTPTITPTVTPTGNAPYLVFPKDNETVDTEEITFDWTDPAGAHHYWFTAWVFYQASTGNEWVPLWDSLYQQTETSSLTISRDDMWFRWQDDALGWLPSQYAWAVTSDTSTCWSETGYFYWAE